MIKNHFLTLASFSNKFGVQRLDLGRVKYRSRRYMYGCLAAGEMLDLKRDYKYRVHPTKWISALEYIMDKLHYRAGIVRDVKVQDYTFYNLPVYSRGGKSIRSLYEEYSTSNVSPLGKHTFFELVRIMTSAGQSKTGLSTYYVRLTHHTEVFFEMIDRIADLSPILAKKGKKLKDECQKWQDFLTYFHPKFLLKLNTGPSTHNCKYAVNETLSVTLPNYE